MEHIEILIIAETKQQTSFPTAQFLMPGFHKPFRLEVTASSGGLLMLRDLYPLENSKPINYHIQSIPFETNLRKEKSLFIDIYR